MLTSEEITFSTATWNEAMKRPMYEASIAGTVVTQLLGGSYTTLYLTPVEAQTDSWGTFFNSH